MIARAIVFLCCVLVLPSCKQGTTAATPSFVQAAGLWGYTLRITSVSSAECLGAALQALIGETDTGTLSIQQTGATLTATSSDSSGATCNYTGTAGTGSIVLNATRCDITGLVGLVCPNGARRDIELLTSAFNATINGNSASGTTVDTFNIFVAGTRTNAGILSINATFQATRR